MAHILDVSVLAWSADFRKKQHGRRARMEKSCSYHGVQEAEKEGRSLEGSVPE